MNNMNNMNNNVISINANSSLNPDGTRTETKIETLQNGNKRITITKYDQNNNIISNQSQIQNMNNFNNFNSNINNVQMSTDEFGNVTETRTQYLPDGGISTMTITRDSNGNIIGQSSSSSGGNNMNNMQINMMNNNMNNMNNMFNQGMNMMNNNINNMNNMFNQGMNMMNNNMNNMQMNMMNMNNDNLPLKF